jgi:membrane-associated phospholipid phosphatase
MIKLDLKLFHFINNLPGKFLRTFFYTIHYLGYIVPAILAVYILILSNQLILTFYAVLFVFLSWIFTVFLKHLFKRPRPKDVHSNVNHKVSSNFKSFPSGHATIMFAICSVLFMLDMQNILQAFIVFAILVSFSRIYLGAHYPSDIIVGIIIGFAGPFILSSLFQYDFTFK